jgi:hypothetical protein
MSESTSHSSRQLQTTFPVTMTYPLLHAALSPSMSRCAADGERVTRSLDGSVGLLTHAMAVTAKEIATRVTARRIGRGMDIERSEREGAPFVSRDDASYRYAG